MASDLSDNELRQRLKEQGVNAGPITDSTRDLYRKKLNQILSPADSAKNRRRSAPPRAVHTQSSTFHPTLNDYSSEDSEVESLIQGSRRNRRRTCTPNQLKVSISKDLLSRPLPSNDSDELFKVPSPPSPARSTRSRPSILPQEMYGGLESLTRPKLKSTRSRQVSSYTIDSSDSDGGVETRRRSAATRLSQNFSQEANFSAENTTTSPKLLKIRPNDHNGGKQNGGLIDDCSFEGEFQVDNAPPSSANYSHLISMFLLALISVFFIVVGVLYMGVKQDNYISSTALDNFTEVLCSGFNDYGCIKKEELVSTLKFTRSLHSILSVAAGEYECSLGRLSSRWMSIENVKLQLQSIYPELRVAAQMERVLENCLLLIKSHPEWGIRILREDGSLDIRAFEAAKARKSLWCRLKLAIQAVFYQLAFVSIVIVSILVAFMSAKVYKKRQKLHQEQIYELVEDIIDILRDRHEKSINSENNNTDSAVPIIHVRDMLIPAAERKRKQKLWEEAVRFVQENESRVLTEQKQLAGEKFVAWRWFQQTSPSGSKKSKVWQGQAFESSGRGVNFLPFSPTPCLKIRNMFDPMVEFGENWHVTIQDAILEKCQGNNGIVHIVVDTKSKDGCVYIKFTSAEAAGQAYRALHGWWFDGKLLTVKYLRLDRYLSRFPESANFATPMKPSNNMQLSLQGGCMASPLESS